jgi:hypothetical protein
MVTSMQANPGRGPICGFCRHALDLKKDVLYQGMGVLRGLSAAYCGWCGSVLGVGAWTTIIGKKD